MRGVCMSPHQGWCVCFSGLMEAFTAEQVRHLPERPAAPQPMVGRLGNYRLDVRARAPYRHHLGLSLSPSAPCILFAD